MAPSARDGYTRVILESDPMDYIGQGESYIYTQTDSRIIVENIGDAVSVSVVGDEQWNGSFRTAQSQSTDVVKVGEYRDAILRWEGDNRGCSTSSGWYAIDSVTYTDGSMTDVALRFEQFCGSATTDQSLRGEVFWSAFDNTVSPGPQNPPPSGLWRPAPESVPSSGDYLYLLSDPDDYVGPGREWLYTEVIDSLVVEGSGSLAAFGVIDEDRWGGDDRWSGGLLTMVVIDQVEPGYYPSLQRLYFHNPYRGGFFVAGGSRGCNESRSWVAIDSVRFDREGLVASLGMRFEQFCDGNTDAIRGSLRWSR